MLEALAAVVLEAIAAVILIVLGGVEMMIGLIVCIICWPIEWICDRLGKR